MHFLQIQGFAHNMDSPMLAENMEVSKENQRPELKNSRGNSSTISAWLMFPGKHPRQRSDSPTVGSEKLKYLGIEEVRTRNC